MMDEKDKRIRELEKELDEVKRQLERAKKEADIIKKENKELKATHSKTVSELRKALNLKANKSISSKPLGAPKGHVGYTRHVPERIDNVIVLNPEKCPDCNTPLSDTQEVRRRHVTDLKFASSAKTTRYDIHRKYCTNCKKIVEAKVPNVLPHARFGLNLMLLVMYLKLGLRLPGKKITEYFQIMHNTSMSEAETVVILRQLAVAFGDYYTHLEKLVVLAQVKYSDTTGWRVNGKNYFAWVFISAGVVLYKIRQRNNHKVGLAMFGKTQKGKILVVDRFSAYRTLAVKAGFLLQVCWSHILQDSKGLAENFDSEGKYVHKKLKEIYEQATGLKNHGTPETVDQLRAEIFLLTTRHYKHNTIRRFVNNLYYRDNENLFRFVTNPEINPTNNISERELRKIVIIRKISNGSRSTRGANTTAMLLSIIQTIRQKEGNLIKNLQNILNSPSGY